MPRDMFWCVCVCVWGAAIVLDKHDRVYAKCLVCIHSSLLMSISATPFSLGRPTAAIIILVVGTGGVPEVYGQSIHVYGSGLSLLVKHPSVDPKCRGPIKTIPTLSRLPATFFQRAKTRCSIWCCGRTRAGSSTETWPLTILLSKGTRWVKSPARGKSRPLASLTLGLASSRKQPTNPDARTPLPRGSVISGMTRQRTG